MRTAREALRFVEKHGVVLESAHGPAPSLAEAIAGEAIRGSWWGHRKGNQIYMLTMAVRDSPDVLVCRLVGGKITFVHRRVWPALVKMADSIAGSRLAAIHEEHVAGRAHRVVRIEYPRWVPGETKALARRMSEDEAREMLGSIATIESRKTKETMP
ncbi:MAG: hypothetical protein ACLQDV_03495 [Candidatus Binataceae bacterium]